MHFKVVVLLLFLLGFLQFLTGIIFICFQHFIYSLPGIFLMSISIVYR